MATTLAVQSMNEVRSSDPSTGIMLKTGRSFTLVQDRYPAISVSSWSGAALGARFCASEVKCELAIAPTSANRKAPMVHSLVFRMTLLRFTSPAERRVGFNLPTINNETS